MAYQGPSLYASAFERIEFYEGRAGLDAPCVFCITAAAHPLNAQTLFSHSSLNCAVLFIADWDNDLTPWPAPGLYKGDADFKGLASTTLTEISHDVIPFLQKTHRLTTTRFALMGYSLGGLFSLYAFIQSTLFEAVAGMSSSLWYEGWLSYVEDTPLTSTQKFAYLSVGTKEKRAKPPILHTVQDNTERTAYLLTKKGVHVTFELNPGNHYQHVEERMRKGFCALERYFTHSA